MSAIHLPPLLGVLRNSFLSTAPKAEVEQIFPGGFGGGVTPDPIPNSEVKPSSADDTTTLWESRSLPGIFYHLSLSRGAGGFFLPLNRPGLREAPVF